MLLDHIYRKDEIEKAVINRKIVRSNVVRVNICRLRNPVAYYIIASSANLIDHVYPK